MWSSSRNFVKHRRRNLYPNNSEIVSNESSHHKLHLEGWTIVVGRKLAEIHPIYWSNLDIQNLPDLPKTYPTSPKLARLTKILPNLRKNYLTYPKLPKVTQNLPDLLKTYHSYPKHTRLTQNLPDLPKTHLTYPKLTGLTQNLPNLPKTYQTYWKLTGLTLGHV